MKPNALSLAAIALVLAFAQTSLAQFGDGSKKSATPKKGTPGVVKNLIGHQPVLFKNALNGMSLESHNGSGLKVKKVEKFSLAQRNGLEIGDIILNIGGTQINNGADVDKAFKSVANSVTMDVVNVNNGNVLSFQYMMTTAAGSYLTNFGKLDLVESPTNLPSATNLSGTLRLNGGGTTKINGTLSNNRFIGTSVHATAGTANFQLDHKGNLFVGHVNQGGKIDFAFIKQN